MDRTDFVQIKLKSLSVLLLLLVSFCFCAGALALDQPVILVERKACRLKVLDKDGRTVLVSPVGLGKGGLGRKRSINDGITPTGRFNVDIILFKDSRFDAVSRDNQEKYKTDKDAGSFLSSSQGLARLFDNMNSLDFNGDGQPDFAYGCGYIGLDAACGQTGPKMSRYGGKQYWLSIALHGTDNESRNIGRFNSGGCIQVPAQILERLIQQEILKIGTAVFIE